MIPAMSGMAASWFRRLNAEDQQVLNDESAKYTASEESRAAKMAQMRAMFDAADVNGDGRLDRAEFQPFIVAVHNDRIARSIPNMSDPSQMHQA